jgi:hypothetical protein
MGVVTVYKVKDLETGLFLNKSCGWDKKGKTWESLGKLKLTLGNNGYFSDRHNGERLFGDDVKIISIKIVETEDNTSDIDDFIEKHRRYQALGKKFGRSFQDLVERIEAQGQNEQFQWVLAAEGSWDWTNKVPTGDFAELLQICKDLKLKQNKDFKRASNYGEGGCVAFASKQVAMTVRLSMRGRCKGIDIKEFVETNLDETETDALNSST